MSRPDELVIKYGIDLDGSDTDDDDGEAPVGVGGFVEIPTTCLLYTSPSPRDRG